MRGQLMAALILFEIIVVSIFAVIVVTHQQRDLLNRLQRRLENQASMAAAMGSMALEDNHPEELQRVVADAARAARQLAGDRVRAIDVGTVTCADGDATRTRYFVNIAEAGLGGAVVARAAGLKGFGRFLGGARYAAGFWLTLPGFRPAAVRLDADGQAFGWRAFNVVVANCRFYGGGMQISPKSDPGDCLLDVLDLINQVVQQPAQLSGRVRLCHYPSLAIGQFRCRESPPGRRVRPRARAPTPAAS